MSLNRNKDKFDEVDGSDAVDDLEINQIMQIDLYKEDKGEMLSAKYEDMIICYQIRTNIILNSFVDTMMKKIPAL